MKKKIQLLSIMLFLGLFISCQKEDLDEIDDLYVQSDSESDLFDKGKVC